jgi:hypothetical protein
MISVVKGPLSDENNLNIQNYVTNISRLPAVICPVMKFNEVSD